MQVDMPRTGIAFSGGPTPAEIVDCVKLAEQLGYESAWVAEGHGGDQFAVLAACATQTSRILLGNQHHQRLCPHRADDRHGGRDPR
jgi:alkanesulfonate monooxygenase SsuD/methylene tetrahydromethanopterin reductase-like flavin-dependent oxidoreductase (luciferase family)